MGEEEARREHATAEILKLAAQQPPALPVPVLSRSALSAAAEAFNREFPRAGDWLPEIREAALNGLELAGAARTAVATVTEEAKRAARSARSFLLLHDERERAGLNAALDAGIASLSEPEQAWIAEDNDRRTALQAALLAQHAQRITLPPEDARTSERDRYAWGEQLWCNEVDALAASPTPEGRLVHDAMRRLWEKHEQTPHEPHGHCFVEAEPHGFYSFLDAWDFAAEEVASLVAEVEGLALWPSVRDDWREHNASELAARATLYGAEDVPGDMRRAEDTLALEVRELLRDLRVGDAANPWEPPVPPAEGETLAGELFTADETAARYFAGLGAEGTPLRAEAAVLAREIRERGRERWAEWRDQRVLNGATPEPPWERWRDRLLFPRQLARVLWNGEVRERLERDSRNPPALALVVIDGMERTFYEQGRQISFLPPAHGAGTVIIRDATGETVATTAVLPASELEGLQRGAVQLRSYMGHLTIRGFVERGWEQTRSGAANPSILGWEGGLAACAEALGARSKKAEGELRLILDAGVHFHREWAGGEVGGLWTYSNQRQAPGRRAYLEVRLGRPLMPYMVKALAPRERTLVPLPPMPPRVAAERTWAPQAAFQLSLVRAMVEKRAELVRHGGARFTAEELARMARAVGLAPDLLRRVLDRWTQDGMDGLACLERHGDRYHLPDNADYREARAFLEQGGRRTLQRKKAGEASVRAAAAPKRRRKPRGAAGQ